MNEERDESKMPLKITPADLDRSRQEGGRRILPPPNYTGRAMRLRLYLLVGSLLLVLVLMEKVRDPDLWRRIGFTEQPAGAKNDEPVWTEVRIAPDGNQSKEESEADSAEKGDSAQVDDGRPESTGGNSGADGSTARPMTGTEPTSLWSGLFRGLNPDELNAIAARMVAGVGSKSDVAIASVAKTLDQRLGSEVTVRLEQISRLSQSDRPQAAAMAESIAGAQIAWRGKLRPWLESGVAILADDPDFIPFDRAMGAVSNEKIEDRTGPARTAEGAAWLLALQKAMLMDSLPGSLSEPGIYRLMTMPADYRAAPIRLTGNLLGIEPLQTAGNALGVEKYWVLWIAEDSGGNVPACVYLTNRPEGFPGDDSGFTKCNVPVKIDGVFFKLRTYTATDRSSAVCPLILSSHAELATDVDAAGRMDAGSGQLPGGWPWMMVGLVALAIGAAWVAWRNIHSGLRRPEPEGMRAGLDVLASDERILTHREQVARLQERMKP